MPAYLISYDLRKVRNYETLVNQLREWSCISPLESLWLGQLKGNAATIRDILMSHIDSDDGLLVMEIKPTSDWGVFKLNNHIQSVNWIRANIGP